MQINISIKAKEYRIKDGLTTNHVADLIGISHSNYLGLENGTYNPTYYTVIDLSKLYNIPVNYIFDQSKVEVKRILQNFIVKNIKSNETDEYIEYKY